MIQKVHQSRNSCRACAGDRLTPFLNLGAQPLANAFLASRDDFAGEAFYPLEVYFCETCCLVQLLDVIDPEILFRDYIYVTGTSETMARHNAAYARTVQDLLQLQASDLVVEVASNDGSLLREFQKLGVRTLGVEPARNLAHVARSHGIETVDHFFHSNAALGLRQSYGQAKAVIANNVLAHVDDTRDFLCGARHLLASDGLLIFEVPYVAELLDRLEYDTIYHEHLCYFSVMALRKLCESAGLTIARIERVPVHGGSLRVYAGLHANEAGTVSRFIDVERAMGLDSLVRYQQFAADVEKSRELLRKLICDLRTQGRTVAAYGAPAKGNTLLNYCRIDNSMIAYTVDRNERKVGLYTPGMHLPVLPVSALEESRPNDVLILAWNFAREIMTQQATYRAQGGRFITPVPQPVVH
jgi:SAM-dependent methyltransferase